MKRIESSTIRSYDNKELDALELAVCWLLKNILMLYSFSEYLFSYDVINYIRLLLLKYIARFINNIKSSVIHGKIFFLSGFVFAIKVKFMSSTN